jgi:hypothetical protein
MEKQMTKTTDWKNQMNLQTISLAKWTLAWALTIALATFGPTFIWESNTWISFTAILINFGIGLGMILANIRHLNTQDELMRRIHLESMGLSLGIGVVGGLSYSILDISNVISSDAEISHLVMLIAITYLISLILKVRKYK